MTTATAMDISARAQKLGFGRQALLAFTWAVMGRKVESVAVLTEDEGRAVVAWLNEEIARQAEVAAVSSGRAVVHSEVKNYGN